MTKYSEEDYALEISNTPSKPTTISQTSNIKMLTEEKSSVKEEDFKNSMNNVYNQ